MKIETKFGLDDVVWAVVDSEIKQCQIYQIIISSVSGPGSGGRQRRVQYNIRTGIGSGSLRDEHELFESREDLGWAILNDKL